MPYCAGCGSTYEDYESADGDCPKCAQAASEGIEEAADAESEIWWAQYEEERQALEKEARRLDLTLVKPSEIAEGLKHQHCLVMKQATDLSAAERATIASDVFTLIQDSTESLGGRLGSDLAYLLGAIARNVQVRMHLLSPLTRELSNSRYWQVVQPFIACLYEYCYCTPGEKNPSTGSEASSRPHSDKAAKFVAHLWEQRRLTQQKRLGVRIEVVERELRPVRLRKNG